MDYVSEIEFNLDKKANKEFLPLQAGDVAKTSANTDLLQDWIRYKPSTSIKYGIRKFIEWYRDFYNFEK